MDFELDGDQEFFRETTRKFIEKESPLTSVRALEHDPDGFDRDWWKRGAELGWTSLLVAEDDGGGSVSGAGVLDAVIVAEEMGRVVSPGPFLPTNVVAAAVSEHGTAAQKRAVLPGVLSGELVGAWSPQPAIEAVADGEGFVLRGRVAPVEAAAQADWLLLAARTGDGVSQFLVRRSAPGVTVAPMGTVDLVKRVGAVDLDGVTVGNEGLLGEAGGATDALERQLQLAVVIQCAETVGAVERVFEFTVEYAGDRYSFGRPLSSYQALKHRFADMKMWLEACAGVATAAARAVQQRVPEAPELVSAAKSYIGDHATEIIQDCVQMHGGIGVTWEHDIHLYLRRATLNRGLYGTPVDHRERIAAALTRDG